MHSLEWLNVNANRAFPLKSSNHFLNSTSKFKLPYDFIVDGMLFLNVNYQLEFYISQIDYSEDILTVTVSLGTGEDALKGSIQNPSINLENETMSLNGTGVYTGSYGTIIIGSLQNMLKGSLTFNFGATTFEPTRINRLSTGINSLNGITNGAINIVSRSNVSVRVEGQNLIIDTIDGLCQCNNNNCVKSINDVKPVNGNIDLIGIGVMEVTGSENGVTIENTVSESCCGCDEINDILDDLTDLERRVTALES